MELCHSLLPLLTIIRRTRLLELVTLTVILFSFTYINAICILEENLRTHNFASLHEIFLLFQLMKTAAQLASE